MKISDKWKYGIVPGLLIHGCLGTIYCWSLITGPVEEVMGVSCEWAFSIAMFFLGLSAAFIGPLVDKNEKLASLISAICFGSGMIISGIACASSNPFLFHIGYGVIMGIGVGIGYVGPIRNLLRWFNDKKGLAAGIAVAGFGLAKVFAGPGFSYFIKHFGITEMFIFHGFLYLLLMLLAVAFIKKPDSLNNKRNISLVTWISELKSTIKLPDIWNYWLILFLNASAGLAIISSEAVFYDYSGITAFGIGYAVSLCAITNTAGRLIVGWGSDFVKHKSDILGIITIIPIISCLIGFSSPSAVSWIVLICNAGYGAMFAILPGALANRYGVENTSKTLGIVFSSWAIAGLTGNQLAKLAMWLPVSYSPRIIIICVIILYLISTYFCTKIRKNNNKE